MKQEVYAPRWLLGTCAAAAEDIVKNVHKKLYYDLR